MSLTSEQAAVVETATQLYRAEGDQILNVEAIAGAGKTYTLMEITKAINPTNGLYLAYNKAIQLEAERKFKDTNVKCKTIHGLAYEAVVREYGLKVSTFTARDISENLTYSNKIDLVNMLESFFLSKELDIRIYLESKKVHEPAIQLLLEYYERMLHGKIGGGHSFYLKLYHILLANGTIKPPQVDLLMVDEFGDITELTIEIFKLMKAKLKIAVGDSGQNIYGFNHTINGFKALKGKSKSLKLTTSFRVSQPIAKRVEKFANSTFDKEMVFKGAIPMQKGPYNTIAYIGRTNASLIRKMFDLHKEGEPFRATRPPSNIFGLILALATLHPGKMIYDSRYKWLEEVARKHEALVKIGKAPIQLLTYLEQEYHNDIAIMSSINIIKEFGATNLFDIYSVAKKYAESGETYPITLTTAHSAKGLEFESVTILDDLNQAVSKAKLVIAANPNPQIKESAMEEFRLYYVAISRCMFELNNAKYC